jgi:hypothetical protein
MLVLSYAVIADGKKKEKDMEVGDTSCHLCRGDTTACDVLAIFTSIHNI